VARIHTRVYRKKQNAKYNSIKINQRIELESMAWLLTSLELTPMQELAK
jgi:hypothetical protein